MDFKRDVKKRFRQLLTIPFITSMIVPILILDIWGEIYHHICFPLCGLPLVKRKNYIRIDRHKLKYLNIFEKFYCVYCGYVNGVLTYWVEIAGQTEKYWCGIRHKKYKNFVEPPHHKKLGFTKYGDKDEFDKKYVRNK